jgi:preprotein translocase subunit SecA
MYHKLSGMTGTASTEAGEFWDIYKLDVVEIPTNRPVIRNDQDDRVYKTAREKYKAVIDEVVKMRNAGRPTLIGTTSVEISELLSRMLDMYVNPETGKREGIPHQVLNAKLHQKEADIVALAGQSTNGKGAVTIATNMAGRGTDIKLSPEVKAAGGLAIIGTERHESRRVDRQLRGRAGRQGDPGSSVFYVSLEDKLMRLFASERIASVMDRLGFKDGEMIESPMISKSIERAQKKVEENNFGIRKRLIEYDDVMNKQRTVIYEKRRHALMGERIGMDIANIIWDRVVNIIENSGDYQGCKEEFLHVLSMEVPFTSEEYINQPREVLHENAFQAAIGNFNRKTERIQTVAQPIIKQVYENQGSIYERIMVPITDGRKMFQIPCNLKEAYESDCKSIVKEFEKSILLHIIDDSWKENLRQLDELKHSVQNASYEQKDPLLIFKLESAKVWDEMINEMYNRICSILTRSGIPEMQQQVQEAAPEQHTQRQQYVESKQNIGEEQLVDRNQQAAAQHDTRAQQNHQPIVKDKLPGRNDPCPCGSGKKFKNCHGKGIV